MHLYYLHFLFTYSLLSNNIHSYTIILSAINFSIRIMIVLYMIFSLFFVSLTKCQSPPTICLEQGACYLGSWATTDKGTKFASFQGIRYAQPPISDLRFKPPQPYIAGEAIWDVSGESDIMCPQLGSLGRFFRFQCLSFFSYVFHIILNLIDQYLYHGHGGQKKIRQ